MQEKAHDPSEPVGFPPNPRLISVPGIGERRVASIGHRVLARCLDWLVLLPFQIIFVLMAISYFGIGQEWLAHLNQLDPAATRDLNLLMPPIEVTQQFAVLNVIWMLASGTIAEVWATSTYGGTPGKLITGLRVVSSQDGGRLSLQESFMRWFLAYFPSLLQLPLMSLFGWVIWGSVLLDTNQYRGWHDKVANSIVVNWKQ